MNQKELAQIENAFKVLEKEGNKVSRDGKLPEGKNADAGHDISSFNAGFRYAMARLKTSIKQIQEGRYEVVDFPVKGQHSVPQKGTTNGVAKAPAASKKKVAPSKKAAPAKAVAKKAEPSTPAKPVRKIVKKTVAA